MRCLLLNIIWWFTFLAIWAWILHFDSLHESESQIMIHVLKKSWVNCSNISCEEARSLYKAWYYILDSDNDWLYCEEKCF